MYGLARVNRIAVTWIMPVRAIPFLSIHIYSAGFLNRKNCDYGVSDSSNYLRGGDILAGTNDKKAPVAQKPYVFFYTGAFLIWFYCQRRYQGVVPWYRRLFYMQESALIFYQASSSSEKNASISSKVIA